MTNNIFDQYGNVVEVHGHICNYCATSIYHGIDRKECGRPFEQEGCDYCQYYTDEQAAANRKKGWVAATYQYDRDKTK